jgi:uncharacterized cupin superfamily protein
MTTPIVNVADAPRHDGSHAPAFAYSMIELAGPAGGRAIGANLTRVPPGKAAFPFHHHQAKEEHFFILSGSGIVRIGSRVQAVRAHDYLVHLPGGPEHAHQLINTGAEDLVYLGISTLVLPEVVGYPDSGKTAVRTDEDAGSVFLIRDATRNTVAYWDDEDGRRVREIVAAGATSA